MGMNHASPPSNQLGTEFQQHTELENPGKRHSDEKVNSMASPMSNSDSSAVVASWATLLRCLATFGRAPNDIRRIS
jgi:hypothetical protein